MTTAGPGQPEPASFADPKAVVARRLRTQAKACAELGSDLYAHLMEKAAGDVESGGALWSVLKGHEVDPGPSALALRLFGAIHRLALGGDAPAVARHFPSCGGDGDASGAWDAVVAVARDQTMTLRGALERTVQTNEVARCAALAGGFLVVAEQTRLPLRLLEVGASAGLNLRWDHFRYEDPSTGLSWGPPESPVLLRGFFAGPRRPPLDSSFFAGVEVRRGGDVAPIDPATEAGRLTLLSFIWPDQQQRFARLTAALGVAARVPVPVEEGDANAWLAEQLFEHSQESTGRATVVYHSVVLQYLSDDGRRRHRELMAKAGAHASARRPLAWLTMEPENRRMAVDLTIWPGGETVRLATAGAHGGDVRWLS